MSASAQIFIAVSSSFLPNASLSFKKSSEEIDVSISVIKSLNPFEYILLSSTVCPGALCSINSVNIPAS